jgi:adenosylhomocysteine nucleosidase
MIGIIAAMEVEMAGYLERLKNGRSEIIAGKEFISGELADKPVVLCLSGIGKVNAAIAASIMAIKYSPSLIINTGLAGGICALSALDIVVADKVCQYDMDTSPLGDPVGYISGTDKIYFDTDPEARKLFLSLIPGSVSGTIASGDKFVADSELAGQISRDFGALSCDMESGAIGHTAYSFNIPFIIVRCISDVANENAGLSFAELAKRASEINVNAVMGAIKKL